MTDKLDDKDEFTADLSFRERIAREEELAMQELMSLDDKDEFKRSSDCEIFAVFCSLHLENHHVLASNRNEAMLELKKCMPCLEGKYEE